MSVIRQHSVQLLCGLLLGLLLTAATAAPAFASRAQISLFEDDVHLLDNPPKTLEQIRELGANGIRVILPWNSVAPRATSSRAPRGFNASDPAAYPAANWAIWDEIVRDATADGITVDLDLMGGAPAWARGGGAPRGNTNDNWSPNAADYGQFVRAVGTRYSGDYDPLTGKLSPGNPDDLPRVSFWSIWNEPNYGPSLAPQGVLGHLTVENSPHMYRNLVDAAWSALLATGHSTRTDTIIWGEFAPRGERYWGVFSGMLPVTFIQSLFCVNSSYHELRGSLARMEGCPTSSSGSRLFRAQNPALFEASGVSDHPYMRWYTPNHELNPDPTTHESTAGYTSLGVIGHLTQTLNRVQGVYGSGKRFPVYDTEFGYMTSPPKHSPDPDVHNAKVYYLSPATAAYYDNWAEYLSWRNPQIATFEQYLLYDPVRPTPANDWGNYASGLLTWNGKQKATYDAWRLPLYTPVSRVAARHTLEIWGCVRPAHYAILDTHQAQAAQIQYQRGSKGAWSTLRTVTIANVSASCYFDIRASLPASGSLRLAYTYPAGDPRLSVRGTVYSRTVKITVTR